jgi:L-ascorbate metabolism protein UlaG (beta-lactamase superfamily)
VYFARDWREVIKSITFTRNLMKRRDLIRYGGAGLLASVATNWFGNEKVNAQTNNSLQIQWLGHSCFLFTGNGVRILVNPFRNLGCTAGYKSSQVTADLVLISSYLLDEGAADNLPGDPKVLFDPGDYEFKGIQFKGISIPHDREGGRRFGNNIAWRWTQNGINILHMGGAAGTIALEQKILMGSPDIALIPVGGTAKTYTPEEALIALQSLTPKVVIPTQYLTKAADKDACEIVSVDKFLTLAKDYQVRRLDGNSMSLKKGDLPKSGTVIRVFNEAGLITSPTKPTTPTTKPKTP